MYNKSINLYMESKWNERKKNNILGHNLSLMNKEIKKVNGYQEHLPLKRERWLISAELRFF